MCFWNTFFRSSGDSRLFWATVEETTGVHQYSYPKAAFVCVTAKVPTRLWTSEKTLEEINPTSMFCVMRTAKLELTQDTWGIVGNTKKIFILQNRVVSQMATEVWMKYEHFNTWNDSDPNLSLSRCSYLLKRSFILRLFRQLCSNTVFTRLSELQ